MMEGLSVRCVPLVDPKRYHICRTRHIMDCVKALSYDCCHRKCLEHLEIGYMDFFTGK